MIQFTKYVLSDRKKDSRWWKRAISMSHCNSVCIKIIAKNITAPQWWVWQLLQCSATFWSWLSFFCPLCPLVPRGGGRCVSIQKQREAKSDRYVVMVNWKRERKLQASPTVARSTALLVCTVEEANLLLREYACRHGHTRTHTFKHTQSTVDSSDVQRAEELCFFD